MLPGTALKKSGSVKKKKWGKGVHESNKKTKAERGKFLARDGGGVGRRGVD